MRNRSLFTALVAATLVSAAAADVDASSHREAPFITKSPKVDSTDFYMFRSYEATREGYVTVIANYQPFQDPYGGPNYFMMDPEALYEIHLDNNGDAKEDLTFQFRFTNALAGGSGVALPIGPAGAQKMVAIPLINAGQITAADTSKLNVAESYSLKLVTGDRRTGTVADLSPAAGFKKPVDYIGTKSLGLPAAYESYARTHIHSFNIAGCASPAKVFVGQRAESFAVNVGTIFDLVNASATTITTGPRDAVPNPIGGSNITTIALELPIACVKGAASNKIIGGWTSASVRQARVINPAGNYAKPSKEGGAWAQVSRLGMPLVSEVVIGIKDKDRFSVSHPTGDTQFIDYVTHPTLPALIQILFGDTVPAPTAFPRNDLVAVFLKGVAGVNENGAVGEYTRLNVVDFLPKTRATQNNLGAAACFVQGTLTPTNTGCDTAGFPNGRRPGDDVTDIALRVVMGYLLPTAQAAAGQVPFHDAVLQDASQFDEIFPYLKTPKPGAT